MKAILVTEYGGPEHMQWGDVPRPEVGPNQVLIKVEATSVNFADIKARYGKKGALPFIPGLDATGRIQEVGEAVEQFHPGQRVICFPKMGSYAEYVVADENLTFALPESIDLMTAAAFPVVSFTSYFLLAKVARLAPGETVLIHAAAGGIGTTALQMAKQLGAGKVIGTVGHPDKQERAYDSGADYVLDYKTFANEVNAITDGQGADVILDSIAGEVTEQSLACLAFYGRLVHFGNSSSAIGHIKTNQLHSSCRSVLGFSFGTTRQKRPEWVQEVAPNVLELIVNGKIDIKIGKHFPLQEAAEAHKWVESRQSTGKVILTLE
ncbi:quinone oxidoreductase family protein [Pullulanibacillus camelliae]|nr:NADPH:quinone oxidoreductase family protein [Pullulanibacillus camelliae]